MNQQAPVQNRLIAGDIAGLVQQNQVGLITDWELICAVSVVASKGVTPKEGDVDVSTGLKYTTDAAEPTSAYVNQD